jgi:dTDP-4-amino-4,6-dideoxygalactose transaminase
MLNDLEYSVLTDFENVLCSYTGAPYSILTDCCTHAIELCLRYQGISGTVTMPKHTYVSALMVLHKLDLTVEFTEETWIYEYCYGNTNVWDSARGLQEQMYRPGQMQCLSFGKTKRLEIGNGGAVLLDNYYDYIAIKRMAYDGRDLNIKPWQNQAQWTVGYHYNMRLEDAVKGKNMLENKQLDSLENQSSYKYPDVSVLNIKV